MYAGPYSLLAGCIPEVLGKLMAVTKTELRRVITKLDDVKIELLRLRAALLPEERVSGRERKLIEQVDVKLRRAATLL